MDTQGENRDPSQAASAGAVHIYEIARWRIEDQTARIESLERKLATIFALNGALIALLSAAFAFRGVETSIVLWSLLLCVVVIFVATTMCAFLAFRLRRWVVRPDLDALQEIAAQVGDIEARLWTAREMWTAYQENEAAVGLKAHWLRRATALTMLNLVVAGIAAMVSAWPW